MRHFLLNGNFSYIPFALRDLSFEGYFLSKIGLKKKTKMKETSFRRKKFFYYKRIKIKGTFCGPTVRCEEQLKAFTVNSRQCCQLVSICALGYPFLSERHCFGLAITCNNPCKLFCCPRHLFMGSGKIKWRSKKNDYKKMLFEFYTYLHYCLHSNAANNLEA